MSVMASSSRMGSASPIRADSLNTHAEAPTFNRPPLHRRGTNLQDFRPVTSDPEKDNKVASFLEKYGLLHMARHIGFFAPLVMATTAFVVMQDDRNRAAGFSFMAGIISVFMLALVLTVRMQEDNGFYLSMSIIPLITAWLMCFLICVYTYPPYGFTLTFLLVGMYRVVMREQDLRTGGDSLLMKVGIRINRIVESVWNENRELLLPFIGNVVIFCAFAMAYFVARADFGISTMADSVYLSAITHTTVGFGDISSSRRRGRWVTMMHASIQFLIFAAGIWNFFVKWQGDLHNHEAPATLTRCIERCKNKVKRNEKDDENCREVEQEKTSAERTFVEDVSPESNAFLQIIRCLLGITPNKPDGEAEGRPQDEDVDIDHYPDVCEEECQEVCDNFGDGQCYLNLLCSIEVHKPFAERQKYLSACLHAKCLTVECRKAVTHLLQESDKYGVCMTEMMKYTMRLPADERFIDMAKCTADPSSCAH